MMNYIWNRESGNESQNQLLFSGPSTEASVWFEDQGIIGGIS